MANKVQRIAHLGLPRFTSLVAIAACMLGSVSAHAITTPWDPVQSKSGTPSDVEGLAATPLPDGRVALAYGSNAGLFFDIFNPSSGTWSGQQTVANIGVESPNFGIAAGGIGLAYGNNSIHVIWNERETTATRDFFWASGAVSGGSVTWGAAGQVLDDTTSGTSPRIPRLGYNSSADRMVAVWNDSTSGVGFRATSWAPSANQSTVATALATPERSYSFSGGAYAADLAINPANGEPAFAGQFSATGGQDIAFAQRNAGVWQSSATNITSSNNQNDRVAQIAFLNGSAVVVYDTKLSSTNDPVSFRTISAGGAVSAALLVVNNGGLTVAGDLEPDNQGNLVGLLRDESTLVRGIEFFQINGDLSVTTPVLIANEFPKGLGTDLVTLSDGRAMAIWILDDGNGNGTIRYAIQEAPIPEPASLAFVGIGGLLLLTRYRRSYAADDAGGT